MIGKGYRIMENGLYLINGKRRLYYQDGKYWEAVYYLGRYTGNIRNLEKQPKIIKSIIKIGE